MVKIFNRSSHLWEYRSLFPPFAEFPNRFNEKKLGHYAKALIDYEMLMNVFGLVMAFKGEYMI